MELKGSQTEKNLQTAFAQESQARNKYTYFADIAKKEGFEHIAKVFTEAADNEKEHARRQYSFLMGIGDTEANLKAAAEGEHQEWTVTYPEFEKTAREEGFGEIADFFKRLARIEEHHEKIYNPLLEDVQQKKVFENEAATIWKCHYCGWFQKDITAPNQCPTCKMPQSGFGPSTEDFRSPQSI